MKDIKKEIQQAIKLYKSHKFSEAELLSKKLIKLNPKIFFLYNLLGLILTGQGKNDESIKYYKRGISIKPDYAMIYNNLGNAYKAKKDYPKAYLALTSHIPEMSLMHFIKIADAQKETMKKMAVSTLNFHHSQHE